MSRKTINPADFTEDVEQGEEFEGSASSRTWNVFDEMSYLRRIAKPEIETSIPRLDCGGDCSQRAFAALLPRERIKKYLEGLSFSFTWSEKQKAKLRRLAWELIGDDALITS